MTLKPGVLLVRKKWPKELLLYLGKSNEFHESKGFLIYDEYGKYYGNVVEFIDSINEYSLVNSITEYLSYIKKHERKE